MHFTIYRIAQFTRPRAPKQAVKSDASCPEQIVSRASVQKRDVVCLHSLDASESCYITAISVQHTAFLGYLAPIAPHLIFVEKHLLAMDFRMQILGSLGGLDTTHLAQKCYDSARLLIEATTVPADAPAYLHDILSKTNIGTCSRLARKYRYRCAHRSQCFCLL